MLGLATVNCSRNLLSCNVYRIRGGRTSAHRPRLPLEARASASSIISHSKQAASMHVWTLHACLNALHLRLVSPGNCSMLHSHRAPREPKETYRVTGRPDNAESCTEQTEISQQQFAKRASSDLCKSSTATQCERFLNRQVRPCPGPACLCSRGMLGRRVFGGC